MSRILIVNDEQTEIGQIIQILSPLKLEATGMQSGLEAYALVSSERVTQYSVILLDMFLKDIDSFALLSMLQKMDIKIPVVACVYEHSIHPVQTALQLGAWDYIHTPYNAERVQVSVRNANKHHSMLNGRQSAGQLHAVPVVDDRARIRDFGAIEDDVMRVAYQHSNGHISEMSRKLNLGRSTLYRKLKRIGIDSAGA